MLRVGLTGGMGSGKTTVAKIFEVLGVPVYYADDAAKRLMNEDGIRQQVIAHFGEAAYSQKRLNRKYLANIVFQNDEKLGILNSIVHPATLHDAKKWLDLQTSSYAVKEAALLFESGAHKDLDYVIGVSSPINLRQQRIQLRDNISLEEVNARMNRQMDETEKMNRCDLVLINDEMELLIPQVIDLHEKLLKLNELKGMGN